VQDPSLTPEQRHAAFDPQRRTKERGAKSDIPTENILKYALHFLPQ
jgi:hypothetical protein